MGWLICGILFAFFSLGWFAGWLLVYRGIINSYDSAMRKAENYHTVTVRECDKLSRKCDRLKAERIELKERIETINTIARRWLAGRGIDIDKLDKFPLHDGEE